MADEDHYAEIRRHAHAIGENPDTCAMCKTDAGVIAQWADDAKRTQDLVKQGAPAPEAPSPQVVEMGKSVAETRALAEQKYSAPAAAPAAAPVPAPKEEIRRGPLGNLMGMDRPGDLVRGIGQSVRVAIPRPMEILSGRKRERKDA